MRYYIMAHYYYYKNALAKQQDGLLRDERGDFLEFDSKEEAQEYINNVLDKGFYFLSHGEYDSPSYEVVSPESWGGDCYLANGTELEPDYIPVSEKDVPPEIREILLSSQVEYVCSEDED